MRVRSIVEEQRGNIAMSIVRGLVQGSASTLNKMIRRNHQRERERETWVWEFTSPPFSRRSDVSISCPNAQV
jgi:hypothetical protein